MEQDEVKEPGCFLCRNERAVFFTRKNNCDIFRCEECNLMFVWPLPENHLDLYSENYFFGRENELGYADYEGDKEMLVSTFGAYLKRIRKSMPPKGKLLDVGAATGHFLAQAKKDGWEASGIEISEYASEIGRKRGLDITTGDFEKYNYQEGQFDAVTFWDILEHFAHPELAIAQARKILKPGGILAINTPDSQSIWARILGKSWHALVPPNHLFFFGRINLIQWLSENDFEVIATGRVGKKFSLQTIFKVLANWRKIYVLRRISNYFLGSRIGNLGIHLNLRDNIFLVARKK